MNLYSNEHERQSTLKRLLHIAIAATLYFLWFGGLVGLRPEHFALFFAVAGAYLASDRTREWVFAFAGLIVFWIIYDSLRICPNYKVNPVHIAEPYLFDKQWFGLNTPTGRITLNEYFAVRTSTALDITTAMFYISWVPLPMLFGVWLFNKNRPLFIQFTYGYLCTNLVGFALYYIYPAAPPWYVELNGFVFNPDTARSAAGLDNFDRLIDAPLFKTIYQRNSNVFAAIPSLHSAYPLVTFFYARQMPQRWPAYLFVFLTLGIWFSAIYLRHHYVIDVILGALTAVAGYFLAKKMLSIVLRYRAQNQV